MNFGETQNFSLKIFITGPIFFKLVTSCFFPNYIFNLLDKLVMFYWFEFLNHFFSYVVQDFRLRNIILTIVTIVFPSGKIDFCKWWTLVSMGRNSTSAKSYSLKIISKLLPISLYDSECYDMENSQFKWHKIELCFNSCFFRLLS